MKTKPAKRRTKAPEDAIAIDTTQTIFSSDLLTPEEERALLGTFWECKSELVRFLIRYFRSGRLDPYGYYCLAAGVVSFVLLR